METLEDSLRHTLNRISESDDTSAEARVLTGVHERRRARRRSRLTVAVGAVAAVGVLTTLNLTGVPGPGGQPETSPRIDANFPNLGCDKQPMSPRALAREFETPIWLPDNATAKVTDSYTCGSGGGWPVVEFGDIRVTYERAWDAVDLNDPGEKLTTIQGQPAVVSEGGDPTGFGKTKGKVMMVVDAHLIRLLAPSEVPIQELVDLAESLNLERPLPTG